VTSSPYLRGAPRGAFVRPRLLPSIISTASPSPIASFEAAKVDDDRRVIRLRA